MPRSRELGYLTRREGILGTASVKVASNWVVSGSARWDLEANKINQYIVGAGYVDDCFVLAANYVTSYTYSTGATAAGAQSRVHAPDRPADHCDIRPQRPAAAAFSSAGRTLPEIARGIAGIELVDTADMTMTTTKPPSSSPLVADRRLRRRRSAC